MAADTHHLDSDREEPPLRPISGFALLKKNLSPYRRACGMHKPEDEQVETAPLMETREGATRTLPGNPPALGVESPVAETWGGRPQHADVLFQ